jgi:alpha-tubulin suppressor-like RCC1 family protein
MNITNLIVSLQQAANSSSVTALDCMALSKMIEKLKVGNITTVANTASLPSTLTTNGNMFYVTADEDLYYNVGSTWKPLTQVFNFAYAWGYNNLGQLGDNTIVSKRSPVLAPVGNLGWTQIVIQSHGLGIASTGILYAWGYNGRGQLGDGTITSRLSPVTVVGGITNWSKVAIGSTHSIGITTAGTAYTWGSNVNGQLGDNTTSSRLSPVTVVGGITTWSQISAGRSHNLGLTIAGVLYGWGYNSIGQLGDGTITGRSSPRIVVGGFTNWSTIAANEGAGGSVHHSLGLRASGILYGWGYNRYGQLGDNTTTSSRSSPVTVVGGITTWSQIQAGRAHSLGLTSTGIVYSWGRNSTGELGDGTITSRRSPVTVVGGINWSKIATGSYFNIALATSGVLYAWGSGGQGQLGDNTTSNRSSPVTVVGGFTTWTQIDAGSFSAIATLPVGV